MGRLAYVGIYIKWDVPTSAIRTTEDQASRRKPVANSLLIKSSTWSLILVWLYFGRMKSQVLLAIFTASAILSIGCKKPAPPPSAATPAADSSSLADRLNAVQAGKEVDPQAALPQWKPFPSSGSAVQIPLQPGLEILSVVPSRAKSHPNEAPLSTLVVAVNSSQVVVHHHNNPQADKERHAGQMSNDAGLSSQPQAEGDHREPECDILVDRADLAASHNLRDYVCQSQKEHFPDTEPFGVSTEVLNQLRAGGQVDFHFIPDSEATSSIGQVMQSMGKSELPALTKHANLLMFSCTLHRVEPFDLAFPVQLNDQQVELPALHATCTFPDKTEGHIYVLDEPDNPVLLWKNMGVLPETLQVVRIKQSR